MYKECLCLRCKKESVARGIKDIKCVRCEKRVMINVDFMEFCNDCANEMNACQRCGKELLIIKSMMWADEILKMKNENPSEQSLPSWIGRRE